MVAVNCIFYKIYCGVWLRHSGVQFLWRDRLEGDVEIIESVLADEVADAHQQMAQLQPDHYLIESSPRRREDVKSTVWEKTVKSPLRRSSVWGSRRSFTNARAVK